LSTNRPEGVTAPLSPSAAAGAAGTKGGAPAAPAAAQGGIPIENEPPRKRGLAALIKPMLVFGCGFVLLLGLVLGAQWYLFRRPAGGEVIDRPLVLVKPKGRFVGASFAPDGKTMIVALSDGTLEHRALPSLRRLSSDTLDPGRRLKSVTFLANGALLIPEWYKTPDELVRERRPVTPPLSWLEAWRHRKDRISSPTLYSSADAKPVGTLERGEGITKLAMQTGRASGIQMSERWSEARASRSCTLPWTDC